MIPISERLSHQYTKRQTSNPYHMLTSYFQPSLEPKKTTCYMEEKLYGNKRPWNSISLGHTIQQRKAHFFLLSNVQEPAPITWNSLSISSPSLYLLSLEKKRKICGYSRAYRMWVLIPRGREIALNYMRYQKVYIENKDSEYPQNWRITIAVCQQKLKESRRK